MMFFREKTVSLTAGNSHYLSPILTYNRVNELKDFDFEIIIDNEFDPPLLPTDEIDYVSPKCRRKDDVYR